MGRLREGLAGNSTHHTLYVCDLRRIIKAITSFIHGVVAFLLSTSKRAKKPINLQNRKVSEVAVTTVQHIGGESFGLQ